MKKILFKSVLLVAAIMMVAGCAHSKTSSVTAVPKSKTTFSKRGNYEETRQFSGMLTGWVGLLRVFVGFGRLYMIHNKSDMIKIRDRSLFLLALYGHYSIV